MPDQPIRLDPIGVVRSPVKEQTDRGWGNVVSEIHLWPEYADGLRGLADFSHAMVITFLHQARFNAEKHLVRRPQGRDDMPPTGIFAQRAKNRPNPLGVTLVEIKEVRGEQGIIVLRGLDAIDGTPVLDIKPSYPHYDHKDVTVPEWVDRLMEIYF